MKNLPQHLLMFPELQQLLPAPIESLNNMFVKGYVDAGIWLNASNHFTIIFTRCNLNKGDAIFQIGCHGRYSKFVSSRCGGGRKYSDHLTLNEINLFVRNLIIYIKTNPESVFS